MEAPLLDLTKYDLRGQQLCGRGRRPLFVGALFVEDPPALVLLDERELGGRRKGIVARVRRRRQENEREPNGPEPDEAHGSSFEAPMRLPPPQLPHWIRKV